MPESDTSGVSSGIITLFIFILCIVAAIEWIMKKRKCKKLKEEIVKHNMFIQSLRSNSHPNTPENLRLLIDKEAELSAEYMHLKGCHGYYGRESDIRYRSTARAYNKCANLTEHPTKFWHCVDNKRPIMESRVRLKMTKQDLEEERRRLREKQAQLNAERAYRWSHLS